MPKHEFIRQIPSFLQYGVTDVEKPKSKDYMCTRQIGPEEIEEYFDKEMYNSDLKKWLSSITWTNVRPEDEFDFKVLSHKVYFDSMPKGSYLDVTQALSEGIELPLGLVEIKLQCHKTGNLETMITCPYSCICAKVPYIIKPKAEEETQEEIITDFITEHFYQEQFMNRVDLLEHLKQKFKITRI